MECVACAYSWAGIESSIPFRRISVFDRFTGAVDQIYADGYIDGEYRRCMEIGLYICPKCGTVRAESDQN